MKLGVVGAGRFGRAFIQGLLKSKQFESKNIWACDRSPEILTSVQSFGIRALTDFASEIATTDIVVLSVKPAQIAEAIEIINKTPLSETSLIVSVAAGTTTSKIEGLLKIKSPVIRAMPNSPCTVQEGFTAICKGSRADSKQLSLVQSIFETLGRCLQIDEAHFDLVTALSGSGPAYFYYFMETMIEAGVKRGLTRDQAVELVAQTAKGAAMMVQSTKRSPTELKKDVATPGGCTMEALKILEAAQVGESFLKAIEGATTVAGNLGKIHWTEY